MRFPSRTLNDIDIPQFTKEQREFFIELLKLTQQDRLALPLESPTFKLQWVSLEAMERQLQWLADIGKAQIVAETLERTKGEPYDPQALLESGYLHDLEEELDDDIPIESLTQMLS